MNEYHVAQICGNGHLVTAYADDYQHYRENYCSMCGSKTIMQCPNCNQPIKGRLRDGYDFGDFVIPKYCYNCGTPYPWTKDRIEATKELMQLELKLSDDDLTALSTDIYSLVTDSPRTQVAAVKFKSILAKAGTVTASAVKDILVDIISESAKKVIWGS